MPLGLRSTRADTLQLLPDEDELVLRVFVDRQVAEAFWMDGRVAMTSQIRPQFAVKGMPQVSLFSNSKVDAQVIEASAWEMQSIWVSKEEVLATPRPKEKKKAAGKAAPAARKSPSMAESS